MSNPLSGGRSGGGAVPAPLKSKNQSVTGAIAIAGSVLAELEKTLKAKENNAERLEVSELNI